MIVAELSLVVPWWFVGVCTLCAIVVGIVMLWHKFVAPQLQRRRKERRAKTGGTVYMLAEPVHYDIPDITPVWWNDRDVLTFNSFRGERKAE